LYVANLSSSAGCDSTIQLQLNLKQTVHTDTNVTACTS
jgi:hypothetical protein